MDSRVYKSFHTIKRIKKGLRNGNLSPYSRRLINALSHIFMSIHSIIEKV